VERVVALVPGFPYKLSCLFPPLFGDRVTERNYITLPMAEGFKLYLKAGADYLDTILNDGDGFPLYKIETNHGITLHRVTTISKIDQESNYVKELAKIAWSWSKSSKLDYRGEEVEIDTFLSREGPSLHELSWREKEKKKK
jgi:hypothetical protein